ncbi:MAG: DUF5050 domain-containing protein [Defluviitaleaceae bacterium]|nr:DUF5050 domain-containing protein [Defluviitaleaceae bacterium]
MPLPIDVQPYSLGGIITSDNYFTHYKATGESGEDFVITEFYPTYMSQREDDGTLSATEQFAKEYARDCEAFIQRATALEGIHDVSLHPIVEVFESNNTAYIVRRACGMITVEQYMGNQQMDYMEAFHFIKPAILSMAQAAETGTTFNVSPQDFRVNKFRQLVVCAPPVWETNFQAALVQLARLYYRLVTGVEAAEQNAVGFSFYGLDIPTRIENIIIEIVNGDVLFGSIDDFYKRFKSTIDDISGNVDPNAGKRLKKILQSVIAALIVVVILAVGLMVNRGIQAYHASYFWANPAVFANSEPLPPPQNDFSAFTMTHPRSVDDPVDGTFSYFYGFVFFRSPDGLMRRRVSDVVMIPGAAGVLGAAEDMLIVEDVRPSFIVGHGTYIYFTNAKAEGAIYRANVTGNDLTRVTNFPALNLTVLGNGLFYTRPDFNNYLFRMDIETGEHQLLWEMPVFAISPYTHDNFMEAIMEERLFVMAGEQGTQNSGIYMLNLEDITVTGLVGGVQQGLRVFNNIIYYLDMDGHIRSMTKDGRHIAVHAPTNVRTFDVFFQWIVFTEDGRHVPRAYNMDTGRFHTLSSTHWASYVWMHEINIYTLDHRNQDTVNIFSLDMVQ